MSEFLKKQRAISIMPSTSEIAMAIRELIAKDLTRIANYAGEIGLSMSDAKKIDLFAKAVHTIGKEERESAKADDYDNASNEDLIKIAGEVFQKHPELLAQLKLSKPEDKEYVPSEIFGTGKDKS